MEAEPVSIMDRFKAAERTSVILTIGRLEVKTNFMNYSK